MEIYNVIYIGQKGRKVLERFGSDREGAIKYAEDWMKKH